MIDWKSIVKTVAPSLGAVLGSPLAGTAIKVLTDTLLPGEAPDEKKLDQIISAGLSPDQIIAVKTADQNFERQMKELDVKLFEIEKDDRDSARKREIALGIFSSIGLHILALIVLGGFGFSVYWIFAGTLPTDPTQIGLMGTVVGYVSAKADQVVSYFFGSSAGSKQKTDAMAQAFTRLK